MPVTVVESVIAGVVVGFATVPANPFAETTDTVLTVPDPDGPGGPAAPVTHAVPLHHTSALSVVSKYGCPTHRFFVGLPAVMPLEVIAFRTFCRSDIHPCHVTDTYPVMSANRAFVGG
jgi:hypothetical protein